MAHKLVIVESPAKARTIAGYLGDGYVVESSIGHIRDLPNNAADTPANGEASPLVIAEATKPVRTMTVSMAVMQLDLAESPALMFRNAANGELNVVYRRQDGNIGWIDPGRGNMKNGA